MTPEQLADLRFRKRQVLLSIVVGLVYNFASGVQEGATELSTMTFEEMLLSIVIGVVGICLVLWILVSIWRFADALDYGWKAWPATVLAVVPILGLFVLYRMLRRYSEKTGIRLDFLLQDVVTPSSS